MVVMNRLFMFCDVLNIMVTQLNRITKRDSKTLLFSEYFGSLDRKGNILGIEIFMGFNMSGKDYVKKSIKTFHVIANILRRIHIRCRQYQKRNENQQADKHLFSVDVPFGKDSETIS